MKKYIISAVLALSIIFVTCAPDGTDKPGITIPSFVYDEDTWNAALNRIKTGGNNKMYTIFVTNNFSVAGNNTIDKTFGSVTGITVAISPGVVTEKGTPEENKTEQIEISLKDESKGSLLYIGNNQDVVIINSLKLKGHMSNERPLVQVDGGSFTMKNNASISGNKATSTGGGGVQITDGTFTMQDSASVSNNTADGWNGGGVSLNATAGNKAVFNMKGGVISGNKSTLVSGTGNHGGGVSVYAYGTTSTATFRIANGIIYGSNESNASLSNTVGTDAGTGAALYVEGGTAERGTFNGIIWNSLGTLTTTENTINVSNGAIVP